MLCSGRYIRRRYVVEVFASAWRKKARAHECSQELKLGCVLCGQLRGFDLFRHRWVGRRFDLRKSAACECYQGNNGTEKWDTDEVPWKLP